MSEKEFRSKDKTASKITRDGLYEENLTTGTVERVSQRKADYRYRTPPPSEEQGAPNDPKEKREMRHNIRSDTVAHKNNAVAHKSNAALKDAASHKSGGAPGSSNAGEGRAANHRTEPNRGGSSNGCSEYRGNREPDGTRHKQRSGTQGGAAKPGGTRQTKPFPVGHMKNVLGERPAKLKKGKTGQAGAMPEPRKRLRFDDTEKKEQEYEKKEEAQYSEKTKKAVKRENKACEKRDKALKKAPKERRLKFHDENADEERFLGSAHIEKNRLHFETRYHAKGGVVFDKTYQKRALQRRRVGRSVANKVERELFKDEKDNTGIQGAHYASKGVRTIKRSVQRMAREHKDPINTYYRREKQVSKLSAKSEYLKFKDKNPEHQKSSLINKQLQKRRFKKKFAKTYRKAKNKTFAANAASKAARAKKAIKAVEATGKGIAALCSSGVGVIILIAAMALLVLLLLGSALTSVLVGGSYPSEDAELMNADVYYGEKEANLRESIDSTAGDHPGYDEYQFHTDAIGHNSLYLLSYLSVQYGYYVFNDVRDELNSIFSEHYTLTREEEIQEKEREVVDSITGETTIEKYKWKILHTTLKAKNFKEMLRERLPDEEARKQFDIYNDMEGLQQVYGNPFAFDWTGDISSPFGWRIHPITGDKKLHDGVDIAEPAGTEIMSCSEGRVIRSYLSSSAGNYIVIEDRNGYRFHYMHCLSRFVAEGETVKKGQVIATVGSTGNSTGNHLHLGITDRQGSYLNPLLLVSSNANREEATSNE